MFEVTFSDGKRRGMAFDGHSTHPVYVTRHGSALVEEDFKKMKRTLAYDDNELSPSGERDASGTQQDLSRLRAAIKKMALKSGMDDGEYQKMLDRVLEHHGEQSQSDGAAATDRHRRARDAGPLDGHGVPGDEDDDDGYGEFRKLLRSKGLDEELIARAVGHARRDREEAADVLPHNALGGRLHGRTGSGTIRPDSDAELEVAYPGIANVMADNYGTRPEPDRGSGYDPAVYRAGVRAAERLPGGGVSRRLTGDAALSIEEQIEREYGGAHIKAGMFG